MNIKQIIREEILSEVGDSGIYSWTVDDNTHNITYRFKTDKGTYYTVVFSSGGSIDRWERTFKADYSLDITNEGDQYKVLATITNITEHFLLNNNVQTLEIHHIHTKDESQTLLNKFRSGDIGPASPNKRARVNRAFLEKIIPDGYTYKLDGIVSTIRRK